LKIGHHRNHLVVTIQDNGRGFNMALVETGRHGLTNMSKRMTELGGTCRVTSQVGKGCRIEFRIPLRQQSRISLPWKWSRK
jgi:signal transduction histidine kinase